MADSTQGMAVLVLLSALLATVNGEWQVCVCVCVCQLKPLKHTTAGHSSTHGLVANVLACAVHGPIVSSRYRCHKNMLVTTDSSQCCCR